MIQFRIVVSVIVWIYIVIIRLLLVVRIGDHVMTILIFRVGIFMMYITTLSIRIVVNINFMVVIMVLLGVMIFILFTVDTEAKVITVDFIL